MELRLTIQKSGNTRKSDNAEPVGHWQQLTKVVRDAHRPVVFEVNSLIADTRYARGTYPMVCSLDTVQAYSP